MLGVYVSYDMITGNLSNVRFGGLYNLIFNLFDFATMTGTAPQQHTPITVGPYHLTHPVNFPCGRKSEYPEIAHDFR